MSIPQEYQTIGVRLHDLEALEAFEINRMFGAGCDTLQIPGIGWIGRAHCSAWHRVDVSDDWNKLARRLDRRTRKKYDLPQIQPVRTPRTVPVALKKQRWF